GGTGPYTAKIDSGSFASASSPKTFTGLSAGSHTVTVQDANGCQTSASITVGQPTVVSLSLTETDVSCNGGSNGTVTATFSGGTGPYTAKIDSGSFASVSSPKMFTGLGAGSHIVTVQDANGCQTSASISVGTAPDVTPPTITCPANIVTNTTEGARVSSNVVWAAPTVSDNCPGVSASCAPPSGSTFAKGTNTVTCTATDGSGNTASCSFTV